VSGWTDEAAGVLTPQRGVLAQEERPDGSERVLHLSLRLAGAEGLDAQREAFSALGPYREVPWWASFEFAGRAGMESLILDAAREHKPSLVVMQVQTGSLVTLQFLRELRAVCPPDALLVNWNGDVRTGPEQVPDWAEELAHGLDFFLYSNCSHPEALARRGVPCAVGYMACGADHSVYRLQRPAWSYPGAGGVVFIGANYVTLDGGARWRLLRDVAFAFPGRTFVYGGGWADHAAKWCGAAGHLTAAHIYGGARVSLSMNLREDLRRYSSGRLTRMLCSGAVTAVRAFDDMEGWGLVHGRNCLVWRDVVELGYLLRDWLRPERDAAREEIRVAAAELGAEHFTWEASARQLWAAVKAARAAGWPKRRTGC
jgi:hypothetical protein